MEWQGLALLRLGSRMFKFRFVLPLRVWGPRARRVDVVARGQPAKQASVSCRPRVALDVRRKVHAQVVEPGKCARGHPSHVESQ